MDAVPLPAFCANLTVRVPPAFTLITPVISQKTAAAVDPKSSSSAVAPSCADAALLRIIVIVAIVVAVFVPLTDTLAPPEAPHDRNKLALNLYLPPLTVVKVNPVISASVTSLVFEKLLV